MNKNTQIFILLILLILAGCSNTHQLPSGSDLKKFDSVVWQNKFATQSDENFISEREKMLKDLIKNILPGKTKSEIENLLGKSLETSYFKSIDKDLIYYMGPQRDGYMNIDSEWLLMWLDKSNKFKKYRVLND